MNVHLLRIHVAGNASDTLRSVSRVGAIAGAGLDGDRYAKKAVTFSYKPKVRDATLISEAAFLNAKRDHGIDFAHTKARRNLVVCLSVMKLNALVGIRFMIGGVVFHGTELCNMCKLPAQMLGKLEREFLHGFKNADGIRARIENDGIIDLTSRITLSFTLSMLPQCY